LFLGAMAISLAGCNSDGTTSITDPGDTSPPQSPANVHTRYDAPTQRDWLVWDPSASANVAGYEVHYSDSPSGIDHNLGSVDAFTNEYPMPLVPDNTTQYYRLRAIGDNGIVSAFTAPIEVLRASWDGGQAPSPDPGKSDDN
jgi:hypothetical protein